MIDSRAATNSLVGTWSVAWISYFLPQPTWWPHTRSLLRKGVNGISTAMRAGRPGLRGLNSIPARLAIPAGEVSLF